MSEILTRIKWQARSQAIRITQHAQEEMDAEEITLDEVLLAIIEGRILEDYPEHRRGACCLLYGRTLIGRHLHIVCTTTQPLLIIITVYEPHPPKWISPIQRREK
ncbi:MAG TPA: DUF4258 domain-containing protein [Ktedonobacteraceae bacterium]|nr:DUF4258 domain-containing protein [Ktedonobacteraceae bacterium]